jgi:2-methylcitrate dehydratase
MIRIGRRSLLGAVAGALVAPTFAHAAEPDIAHRLAQYVADTSWDALDATTIETAKAHLIDSIGCAIVAFDEPPVRAVRSVALAQTGACTVLGTTKRTTPDLATFANGAALRYYDYNDTYFGKEPGHPSDNMTACLAMAEAEGRSGRDFLLAMVLAYEIDCRLLDAAELTRGGWDHPIDSLPAAALGAGKLMNLSAEQLAQAVNIAINGHIAMNQTRVQVMSDWKGLADAESGRNGVFAALLARAGITGPAPIFEGNAGLFKQVSGPFAIDVDKFGGRHGTFLINDCDVKPYPAQGGTITAIPAAVAVAKEVGDLDQIASIKLDTPDFTWRSAGRDREKWAPETKETADHSLPFVAARAMLDGSIGFDSFAVSALHDPKVLALMAKMTVNPDPALTALAPKMMANRVTATLKDGRVVTQQVNTVPGMGGTKMQPSDFERKFAANVGKVWPAAQQRRVLDAIWSIDKADKLDDLLKLLVVPA